MQICLFIIANIRSPACPWPANNEILIRIFSPEPLLSRAQPTFYLYWLNKLWSVLSGSNPCILEAGLLDSKISIYAKNVPIPVWKWDVKHLNHKVAIIPLDWLVHFCQLVPKYEYMTHHKYAMNQPTLHLYYTWMIDHTECCPNSFIVQYKILQVHAAFRLDLKGSEIKWVYFYIHNCCQ